MPNLNSTTQKLRFKKGTSDQITAAENAYGEEGEALYLTDRKQLLVHNNTKYETVNKYTEYIFNSSGSQSGSRFNTWSDLYDEIRENNNGSPCRITFEQNETIPTTGMPVDGWVFDGIRLAGNGTSVLLGGLQISLASGTIIKSWSQATLEKGCGLLSLSSGHVMTISSGSFTMQVNEGSGIASFGGESFFDVQNGATCIVAITGGSAIIGSGFGGAETFDNNTSGTVIIAMSGSGTTVDNQIVKGAGSLQYVYIDSSPELIAYITTNTNYSGTPQHVIYPKASSMVSPTHYQTASTLTISYHHTVIADASSNAITITLPLASSATINLNNIRSGREVVIVGYDATNTITVQGSGSEQIRGISSDTTTSVTVSSGQILKLVATRDNSTFFWLKTS